jgi:flagellar export protein FliJ
MTNLPRGFHFALEPVRRKHEWDVEHARLGLADANRRVAEIDERLEAAQVRFAAARAEWGRRISEDTALNAHSQRIAAAYLADVTRLIREARAALDEARRRQREAIERIADAQRALETIERLRDEDLREHRMAASRRALVEADELWLHRDPRMAGPE